MWPSASLGDIEKSTNAGALHGLGSGRTKPTRLELEQTLNPASTA